MRRLFARRWAGQACEDGKKEHADTRAGRNKSNARQRRTVQSAQGVARMQTVHRMRCTHLVHRDA